MQLKPETVRDVVDLYLTHTAREQGKRTLEGRRHTLGLFVADLGTLTLAEAKPYHLRLWVDAQDQWKSDWTRKGAVSSIQRAFNWAQKLGMIDRNPFTGVTQREGEPGRAMTDAEFGAALRSSTVSYRRVLIFLRFTGCRPCEMRAIEPEHVDLLKAIVTLADHKTVRQQKRRRPRVIVLHAVAVKLLAYLLRTMVPDQDVLFINAKGQPWNRYSLATRFKRLRKRLGLPDDCRPYGLRHKFGTDAILAHVEIKTLSVLMGHTTTRTTERYVHVEDELEHLGEAVRQVMGRKPR